MASVLGQLETLLYGSDGAAKNMAKIQSEKKDRGSQRDEDERGVPGGHANTHSQESCVGAGVYLLQALGAEPVLAEKISIPCGIELAYSPDPCSIYLPSL